ncbi:MAG: HAMP domain-containing sensor histidine kinase [Bacteroides sp.]
MIKKTILLLLCFLANVSTLLWCQENAPGASSMARLFNLASKNFIFSSAIPEDSIIDLADRLEVEALGEKDYSTYFKIAQIKVNAFCLKGDIGLATDEAKRLYERARTLNLPVGIALSLQSIGNTYMHLEQFEQALAAFKEAEKLLSKGDTGDNNLLLIRIYLHNVHVCWSLDDLSGMSFYLDKLSGTLPGSPIASKENYEYYTLCYRAFYLVEMRKTGEAFRLLTQIQRQAATTSETFYKRCYYWVASYYNTFTGNCEKALLFADSALVETRLAGNLNEYRNSMIEKAALLEKMGQAKNACEIYQNMEVLTVSLNTQRYARQVEHLHATYLADQLGLENQMMDNVRFAWLVGGCCIVLLGSIALVFNVRQKNQKMLLSQHKLMVAREETTRSVYSKSMLLSNMSHELRTPLNAIVGFSDFLSNNPTLDADTKKQCGESIRQNAGLLQKLIKDVMDFSEFNIGEMSYTCEMHNVVSICKLVVDTVESVKQTAAEINFKSSCKELYLYTDSSRLQQVLINLLINSTKFTKSGTISLTVQVDKATNKAIFTIEDTGCGIPLEQQAHIFERFEKLHEGVQGSGLGLSICQLIVENFGGSIWIDSSYVQGARFIFTHPLPPFDIPAL